MPERFDSSPVPVEHTVAVQMWHRHSFPNYIEVWAQHASSDFFEAGDSNWLPEGRLGAIDVPRTVYHLTSDGIPTAYTPANGVRVELAEESQSNRISATALMFERQRDNARAELERVTGEVTMWCNENNTSVDDAALVNLHKRVCEPGGETPPRCDSCGQAHSPDVMCPPHEVRTTGQALCQPGGEAGEDDLTPEWKATSEAQSKHIVKLQQQLADLLALWERGRAALETIEAWKDFPATADGKSYVFLFGSNGARDHMRGIARAALERGEAGEKRNEDECYADGCEAPDEDGDTYSLAWAGGVAQGKADLLALWERASRAGVELKWLTSPMIEQTDGCHGTFILHIDRQRYWRPIEKVWLATMDQVRQPLDTFDELLTALPAALDALENK